MRLWIAENVLCDWSCGIAIIHASSEKKAIDQFFKDDPMHAWVIYGTPDCKCKTHKHDMNLDKKFYKYHKPKHLPHQFKEIKEPYAIGISGGS